MPETTRPLADGYDTPERQTRHHWFGGSLIAKHPDFEDEIKPLRNIFGSGVTLSVDRPPDAECSDRTDGDCPPAVRVHNRYAGHLFPTGNPDRHAEVEVTVRDADGEILAEHFQRIGSKYEWYPEIELLEDNRIEPDESLWIDVDWPDVDEALSVEIEAHKYRMYQDDFDYHDLQDRYVRGRWFHTSEWTVDPDGTHRLEHIEDDFGERTELLPDDPPPTNRPDDR